MQQNSRCVELNSHDTYVEGSCKRENGRYISIESWKFLGLSEEYNFLKDDSASCTHMEILYKNSEQG
jgi:hypothetical protein